MSVSDGPRVLLIAESADTSRGGQERSLCEYAQALSDLGFSVTIASGGVSGPPPGIAWRRIPSRGWTKARQLREFQRDAGALVEELRHDHVVQTLVPVPWADFYVPRSGILPETFGRSVATRRSPLARSFARLGQKFAMRRRLLIRSEARMLAAENGPRVIAISSYMAEAARLHHPKCASRIHLIRNGIRTKGLAERGGRREEVREALGIDGSTVVFLALANNFARKGIPELVSAVQSLPDAQGFLLLVAGRGRPLGGRSERVRFLGPVDDPLGLIRAADVVVNPSHYDPCSRVILEGLALGRPVLTTRFDGASDFAQGAGLVIDDPKETRHLALALASMLDPEARRGWSVVACERRDWVSMERHAREMATLLLEVKR